MRPLDQQPLFGVRLLSLVSRCAGRTPCRAQRSKSIGKPSRQVIFPTLLRAGRSERFGGNRPVPGVFAVVAWTVVRCPGHAAMAKARARPLDWAQAEDGDLGCSPQCHCCSRPQHHAFGQRAVRAALICSKAISGLVWKATVSRFLGLSRPARSWAQSSRR